MRSNLAYNMAQLRIQPKYEELIDDVSTPEEVAELRQNCADDLENLVDYFID